MTETTRQRSRMFGNIRKLPSGRFQARYLGADGKRRSAPRTFATKADASAWLSKTETDTIAGEWRPPELGRETFGTYGKRWLAHRQDLRPRTRELYAALWRLWLEPAWADVSLSKMTAERWRTWWVETTAAHPGSTQPAKAYRLARAMLNQAVDDGLLRANPCRVKGAGRETAAERPIAMPEQVAKIAEAIDKRYRVMVLLAAYCSLRFGELAGLRRSRVNPLHRSITVEEQAVELANGTVTFGPPKSEAGRRVVHFPAELLPAIEHHLATFVEEAPDALLFTSLGQRLPGARRAPGVPLRRTAFRPHWEAACEKASITGLHFHDLRGSGATWAATGGATVRELMARLGHATPTVALRYQHATLERDKAIADRLGTLYRADDPEKVDVPTVVGQS